MSFLLVYQFQVLQDVLDALVPVPNYRASLELIKEPGQLLPGDRWAQPVNVHTPCLQFRVVQPEALEHVHINDDLDDALRSFGEDELLRFVFN